MNGPLTLNIPPSRNPNGDCRAHLGSRLLGLKTTCIIAQERIARLLSSTSPGLSPRNGQRNRPLIKQEVQRGPPRESDSPLASRNRSTVILGCDVDKIEHANERALEEASSRVHDELPSLQVGSNLCHTQSCGCKSQIKRKNRTIDA